MSWERIFVTKFVVLQCICNESLLYTTSFVLHIHAIPIPQRWFFRQLTVSKRLIISVNWLAKQPLQHVYSLLVK